MKKRGDKSATKRANINKNILRIHKIHQRLTNIRKEYVKAVVSTVTKSKPLFITLWLLCLWRIITIKVASKWQNEIHGSRKLSKRRYLSMFLVAVIVWEN